MNKLKVISLSLTFILAFLWIISFYFCLYPLFLKIEQWSKLNFIFSFLFWLPIIFLNFFLSENYAKNKKYLIFLFIAFAFIFLISFPKILSIHPLSILILSLFFMFLFWTIALITGARFKNQDQLKNFYSLIVVGFLILFNAFFYFGLLKNVFHNGQIFWGFIFSLFLLFLGISVMLTPFFDISFFLTESAMVIAMGLTWFLFFSSPELFVKKLALAIFFIFLFFFYRFKKIMYNEMKRTKEIEKIFQEERDLLEAKEQFVLSIQHHLRTPLGPIREYLNRILKGVYGGIDNPVVKEKLVEIKKLADEVYSLVEQLIDIQALKTKRASLNLEKCKIEEIIESVIEELLPIAEEKGLYLKYEKSPLPLIEVDKKKIRETIFNMVDNGIKYTRRGGVTIKTMIEDKKLKIEISDTGIGMEKEEIEKFLKGKIFERGTEAKKMYGPGKGIGLSLAIQFVKAHGGEIFARSEGFGKGTTFLIELPIK
jgi:signal transduction histidine kinase